MCMCVCSSIAQAEPKVKAQSVTGTESHTVAGPELNNEGSLITSTLVFEP